MPNANRFGHQLYSADAPSSVYRLIHPLSPLPPDSGGFADRMKAVGRRLRRHRVAVIYLLHGSFVGDDTFGLFDLLGRAVPDVGRFFRRRHKSLIDALTGDSGNYTREFSELFRHALNDGWPERERITVRPLRWSGENHHSGRCDGAVRLLHDLNRLSLPAGSRVLLWGHSHAGNLFALLTNLLSADRAERERFFSSCRHLRSPLWQDVERALDRPGYAPPPLDIVTFGTPPRYGWDSDGYAKLLHVVQHRPQPGRPDYLSVFPFSVDDLLSARAGDYIQQLGLAGSDFAPSLFNYPRWRGERALAKLLSPETRRGDLLRNWRLAQRVPAEGGCLLVDYPDCESRLNRQLAGHAIYTRREWLLFHAEQTVRAFYAAEPPSLPDRS